MEFENLQADLDSHHIEGVAIHGDTPFSMPLISHITENLWTGGCIDGVELPHDFKHVVSLYPWEKYKLGPDTERLEHKLYDSAEIPEGPTLYSVAGYVVGCLREGKTLVHCQAGLNRSALVGGLALALRGMSSGGAISLLREQRSPAVLCNRTFEEWLLAQQR